MSRERTSKPKTTSWFQGKKSVPGIQFSLTLSDARRCSRDRDNAFEFGFRDDNAFESGFSGRTGTYYSRRSPALSTKLGICESRAPRT